MKGIQSFLSGVQGKLGGHSQASSAAAAHKIVDKDFDKEKENLKTFMNEAQDVIKSLKAQSQTIRSWFITPLNDIDSGLRAIYGESHGMYLAFQKTLVNIQSASLVFDQEQDAALGKMNECIGAANELKKAVAQRDAKVNEVDRACVQVFQLQGGRDVSKAQAAMTKYKSLKEEYEKMNADVLFQIRTFLHQRPERFDVHFKDAMISWDKFFETAAGLFSSLEGTVSGTVPTHPPNPLPPLPPKPTVDLLSGDDAAAPAGQTAPLQPTTEPAAAPAPEPSTAKSRVEKFGVRMLPVMPTKKDEAAAPAEPAAAAAAAAAAETTPASPAKTDAPPPLPPKPAAPEAK